MTSFPVRVLVVDDSAYLRKVVSEMLMRSPRLEVVGTARNGREALEKVLELKPDVVTLDLFMDELDGVGFLKEQMARQPLPVVVCSIASEEGKQVMAAMEAGAVEFVHKPTALSVEGVYDVAEELTQKVVAAAGIAREKLWLPISSRLMAPLTFPLQPGPRQVESVVLGLSTGGPQALHSLLPRLPANFPVPIAIVLHMPVGYTSLLAEKLDDICPLEVLEAYEGLEMKPGRVILAKAGYHLWLRLQAGSVKAHLDLRPENSPHRPAVDVLFRSAAEVYGGKTLGVVLTGMGNDGTTGAAWIKAQGGKVITESAESSVVYGMPRSVAEAGLSDSSVPLEQMANRILEML